MVFALSASFLWVVTVIYSAGYMRGLEEHAQTRFNTCFALALFGATGCAFSDNLLTLYLFYEIVSVCSPRSRSWSTSCGRIRHSS